MIHFSPAATTIIVMYSGPRNLDSVLGCDLAHSRRRGECHNMLPF